MKLIFEKTTPAGGINLTDEVVHVDFIAPQLLRKGEIGLPRVSELEVMRHYKELSDRNFCIEKGFYPLGSCTMKYNPKVNELLANLDGFANLHPLSNDCQGALELMFNLQGALEEITGMAAVSLQPAAGAHGELTGMMIVKKYFESRGETRKKVLIPDSAHGTNPATAAQCGFETICVPSNEKGQVDIDALKSVLDKDVAAIMMTNPNTLGIFEENVLEISKLMHDNGSLLYYDGANLNAVMGYTNPALMGFDIVHVNLHKTFATPHGGGGPGAGPVGVVSRLAEFLPPVVQAENGKWKIKNGAQSIGSMKGFYGNFGVLVRAYAYILMMGANLKTASADAVLNANYLKEKLKGAYLLPYDTKCMHEFVLSSDNTMNIAKSLMKHNIHPPTVFFPLIVPGAMMIEPTETETKARLDEFVQIMLKIKDASAPENKIDEVRAVRQPDLRYAG